MTRNLVKVKARSELDESRQNLSTLIDNAYFVSHSEDDISRVVHIITKTDSSVTSMSERLKSLGDSDEDFTKQDSLLIEEEAPKIVRSLRTRISHLQRREITVIIKNKNARKTVAAKANV